MTDPTQPESADVSRTAVSAGVGERISAASPSGRPQAPDSQEQFACFYRTHIGRLGVYLLYQGAPAHLAAEFAQEAMITAYQKWDTITSPGAYTYTVAYRAFLRYTLRVTELPVAEVAEPTALLPRPGDAEAWLQEQEILELLRTLPPRQRQILALTLDGWSPSEIAELLEIEASAIRSSLMKARRATEKHLRAREADQ
jgi:RNA polymerase sigma factor (sigma-70 family)